MAVRTASPATRKKQISTGRVVLYTTLVVSSILMLFPFYWTLAASLKLEGMIFASPPQWIPDPFTLEHYHEVLTRIPFVRYFVNSVFIAVTVTVLRVMFDTLAGYAFAKLDFPGRDKLFFLLLLGIMIPFQVNLIPVFRIVADLGWLDSFAALIVPRLSSVLGIFLMRQYIMSIPDEILDSARIDGAGELKVFTRIVIPLSLPGMAALAIFTFMEVWNDFLWPRLVLSSEHMFTLPLGLAQLQMRNTSTWGTTMAGAVITAIPLIVVFLLMQRQFIAGMTEGAVKR